jgi:general secretion pathway protein E
VISEIESVVQRQYGDGEGAMAEIVDDLGVGGESAQDLDDVQHLKDLASEAPVVRLVNLVITRALGARASDIHIEPFDGRLQVRYRVDGVLRLVESPPVRSTAAVISRIKVMANLNIAERRLPQDGRIKLRIEGREIDMRISTIPILHGESVVMRILDKGSVPLNFESLGFTGAMLDSFRAVLGRPDGIVLVTGPTGSGKTTTLYAALQTLNTPENKVLTVEDPVEYQLEGVNQIQVKPQIGLSFADALRSILRQDPDVIMVGEMRDLETAKIAVQAALTGHKVFSTLHTNDAASSVTRLLDMGVEDYLVTSTVNGVLAQRLVRTLCPDCKTPTAAPARVLEDLRQRGLVAQGDDPVVHRATGCPKCDGIGYLGRSAILELVAMTDGLRRAILERGEAMAVREAARADGSQDMHLDGLRKVLAGQTTIEEVERVTREV